MSSFEFETVERLAKRICEDRHGAGSWDAKHRRKADFRAKWETALGETFADPGHMPAPKVGGLWGAFFRLLGLAA